MTTTDMVSTKRKNTPSYLHEFPNYDDTLRMIAGFDDGSYHNDAMPCILKEVYLGNETENPDYIIYVYQDYKKRNLSEIEIDPTTKYLRYSVDVMDREGYFTNLLTTNSWDSAKKCALKTISDLCAQHGDGAF